MGLHNFAEVLNGLKLTREKRKFAVVAAHDRHTLEAVVQTCQEQLMVPLLIGEGTKIEKILEQLGQPKDSLEILDIPDAQGSARKAVELVQSGTVQCVMKGKIETAALMKVMVDKASNLGSGSLMSHVIFLEIPTYHKILAITDGGLNMYPTLEQKSDILENAVATLHKLGLDTPKVAVLAAIEEVNAKMPETIHADVLKRWNQQGDLPGCLVEGPLSYDLAVSKEAAAIKGYQSPVAGDADVLLVPNIVAGNLLSKALICSAGAKYAGFVAGASVPIVLTSRSASSEDKYLSLALAVLVGSA